VVVLNSDFNSNDLNITALSESELRANVFVKFMNKMDYLLEVLEEKSIAPRYVAEDISIFGLELEDEHIEDMWIPMICFCDIPLNKVDSHTEEYGEYGIALKRQWGINKKLTPINYIIKDSEIHKETINLIEYNNKKKNQEISSYIMNLLFYCKPIEGYQRKKYRKFIEEQEWRHVSSLNMIDNEFAQFYYKENFNFNDVNEVLKKHKILHLPFTEDDIKYLIVPSKEKVNLIEKIMQIENFVSDLEKYKLISKIVSLSEIKEDFI
jgi:hypothetical protein